MAIRFEKSITAPLQGPVRIWEEPQSRVQYVVGADVAEGLEHGDYSSAHVLNSDTGVLAATWHDHTDPDLFGEQLDLLGRYYNNALVGVEINNHGHVTVSALRRLRYPRLFRRRAVGQVAETMAPQFGWHTNKVSKPKLIEGLNSAIRDGVIDVRDEHTLAELRTYIREYTTGGGVKMHGSPYDDRVMSLAIAVEMLEHVGEYAQAAKTDDVGTFDYYVRIANQKEAAADPTQIGQFNVRKLGR